jgi:hypothetical protein
MCTFYTSEFVKSQNSKLCGSSIAWPSRLPGLNPNDFLLWGYPKKTFTQFFPEQRKISRRIQATVMMGDSNVQYYTLIGNMPPAPYHVAWH